MNLHQQKNPKKKKVKEIDWTEVIDFCYAELALKPNEYNRLLFCDYIEMQKGWYTRRAHQWELVRLLAWCVQGQYAKKMPSLDKYMPLITDRIIPEGEGLDQYSEIIAENRKQAALKRAKIPTDKNLVRI